jgi:hypothetical protein
VRVKFQGDNRGIFFFTHAPLRRLLPLRIIEVQFISYPYCDLQVRLLMKWDAGSGIAECVSEGRCAPLTYTPSPNREILALVQYFVWRGQGEVSYPALIFFVEFLLSTNREPG